MMKTVDRTENERMSKVWKKRISDLVLADVIITMLFLLEVIMTRNRRDWNYNSFIAEYILVTSLVLLYLYQLSLFNRNKYSDKSFSKQINPWMTVLTGLYGIYGIYVITVTLPPLENKIEELEAIIPLILIFGLFLTGVKISSVTANGKNGYKTKEAMSYYSMLALPLLHYRYVSIIFTARILRSIDIWIVPRMIYSTIIFIPAGLIIFGVSYMIYRINQRYDLEEEKEDETAKINEGSRWLDEANEKLYPKIISAETK